MLPVILVRNQIGDMLDGETGKFTCRKNKVKFGTSSKKFRFLYNIYWYNAWVQTSRLLVLSL
jgi:hypothetical protein